MGKYVVTVYARKRGSAKDIALLWSQESTPLRELFETKIWGNATAQSPRAQAVTGLSCLGLFSSEGKQLVSRYDSFWEAMPTTCLHTETG